MQVDLVLVVPFCPQCHVAAAVLARAIEALGLPTISATTLIKPALADETAARDVPRLPPGCPIGRPGRPEQQREILRAVLEAGFDAPPDSALRRLPFQWDENGSRAWEGFVDDVYGSTTPSEAPWQHMRATTRKRPRPRRATSKGSAAGVDPHRGQRGADMG